MSLLVMTETKSYCLQVRVADNSAEILECQNLIAETYYEAFGISLSDRSFNLKEKTVFELMNTKNYFLTQYFRILCFHAGWLRF